MGANAEGIACRAYYDTGETIKEGAVVFLDNHRGVVEAIFDPGTDGAKAFNCVQNGGILIQTEDFGLMLVEFGDYAYLTSKYCD